MNKTAKITIGILIVICGFLFVFSKIQANEAKKQKQSSVKLLTEVEMLRVEAKKWTARAERLAADAIEAQMEAERAIIQLQECEDSK
ncbi:MAG: hypothetical protein ACJA08_003484 [Cyclobacteriaceae bacterium]|jgi:hypothetical protein